MPILLKPIATRFFVFMTILGLMSTYITIGRWDDINEINATRPWWLLFDVYVIAALLTLIRRRTIRITLKGIIYAFTYPLYIIDTFCFVKFGSTLSPSMLLTVVETNTSEASEFFSSYLTPNIIISKVGLIALVPLAHILCIIACRYSHLFCKYTERFTLPHLTKPVTYSINAIIAVAVIILGIFGYENKQRMLSTMCQNTIAGVERSLNLKPHVQYYQPPLRLAFAIRSNMLIANQVDMLISKLPQANIDTCTVKSPNIVLIIGESYNRRHSQLYGYDKKTTPNQVEWEQKGLLTKFTDAVSPWNLTSHVFMHLMTTYCVGDKGEWYDYPLFCQLFRKAGYQVTFLTNQFLPSAKNEVYDVSGGFFLNDSTLSAAQFDIRNKKLYNLDHKLLIDYDKLKDQNCDKPQLRIFHLMGSHVTYKTRCPGNMKRWGLDCYPNDSDMTVENRRIMAYYDDSVWYNDSVMGAIVDRFKDKDAIVIFLPDHGEEVFGPGMRDKFGRIHPNTMDRRWAEEEVHIPMWIYCTPQYKRRHPDVVRAIRKAKDKPYMTDALSHTLLSLAGIKTKYYNPQYDILSPQYNAKRKRIIRHQADYDTLK